MVERTELGVSTEDKCSALEQAVRSVASSHARKLRGDEADQGGDVAAEAMADLRARIKERKECRASAAAGSEGKVRDLSKEIQRGSRRVMRLKKRARIRRILTELKGLRHIAGIRNNCVKKKLSSVVDIKGGV